MDLRWNQRDMGGVGDWEWGVEMSGKSSIYIWNSPSPSFIENKLKKTLENGKIFHAHRFTWRISIMNTAILPKVILRFNTVSAKFINQ